MECPHRWFSEWIDLLQRTTPEAVGANRAGGRAPHGTRESSSNSWRREHHRIDVPPACFSSRRDGGFMEPGSVRLHRPGRGGFLDRYGTGGVRAVTFFATTPVSREALDHRLLATTASGVALLPQGFPHVDTRLRISVLSSVMSPTSISR